MHLEVLLENVLALRVDRALAVVLQNDNVENLFLGKVVGFDLVAVRMIDIGRSQRVSEISCLMG